jgi:hypothetical protein
MRPSAGCFAPQSCPCSFFPVILEQHLDPGKVLASEEYDLLAKIGH